MNAFQRIQYSRPRVWAALAFFPFLFATVVVSPIAVLFDVASECPRVFGNFYRDFAEVWRRHTFNTFSLVKEVWATWLNSFGGKQPLCEQRRMKKEEVDNDKT